jgi:hypothetical protein
MCTVKAEVLAIELATEFQNFFFVIVVVVVVVLPLFLVDAFVTFDGLAFKDELGLCSKSGDVPIKVELLPPG